MTGLYDKEMLCTLEQILEEMVDENDNFSLDPELLCVSNDGGETIQKAVAVFDTSVVPPVATLYDMYSNEITGYEVVQCEKDREKVISKMKNGDGTWSVITFVNTEDPDDIVGPIFIGPDGQPQENPGDLVSFEYTIEQTIDLCPCESSVVFFHELDISNKKLSRVGLRGVLPTGATYQWDMWNEGNPSPYSGPPSIPTTEPSVVSISNAPILSLGLLLVDETSGSAPLEGYNNRWLRLRSTYNGETTTIRYFIHAEGIDETNGAQFQVSMDNGSTRSILGDGYQEIDASDIFTINCSEKAGQRVFGCNDNRRDELLSDIKRHVDKSIRPIDYARGMSFENGQESSFVDFAGVLTVPSFTVAITSGDDPVEVSFDHGNTRPLRIPANGSRSWGNGDGGYAIGIDGILFRGGPNTNYDVIWETQV